MWRKFKSEYRSIFKTSMGPLYSTEQLKTSIETTSEPCSTREVFDEYFLCLLISQQMQKQRDILVVIRLNVPVDRLLSRSFSEVRFGFFVTAIRTVDLSTKQVCATLND